jgi:hypothetical protein
VFVELMPLLAGRTVLVTVAKVDAKTLRVNGSSFSEAVRLAPFLPRWKLCPLKSRLSIAFGDGQVYVDGRAASR